MSRLSETVHAGGLYAKDSATIAGVEKLRFFPAEITGGAASRLYDLSGRSIIDLSATWAACPLGYSHPALTKEVTEALENQGFMGLSMTNPRAVELAEELRRIAPGQEQSQVYFGHSGSDACEVALRCARRATGRRRIVAFHTVITAVSEPRWRLPDCMSKTDPYLPSLMFSSYIIQIRFAQVPRELTRMFRKLYRKLILRVRTAQLHV